jgi:hypothetical protein
MKHPSPRLLVAIGAFLTLASGALLCEAVATTAEPGGPYGFLNGLYVVCLVPGALLLLASIFLFTAKTSETFAGVLGIGAAMASIPFALAGFWVGFAFALVGSLLVIRRAREPHSNVRGDDARPSSPSPEHRQDAARRWAAPAGVAVVALVAILLACPQTLSADLTTTVDLVNAPVAYDLQAAYVADTGGNSLSYQVNAVSQSGDCPLGYAYFVNAYQNVSGQVYWYQVGLSYDWGGGALASSGWGMAYEVFGPDGDSIYPTFSAGAGVAPFSGPVNPGDSVVLTLSVSGGVVSFSSSDTSTSATASQRYTAAGSQSFGGLMPRQDPGYFTGVMTECYRQNPGGGSLNSATFTDQGASQSAAGVLVDEINFSWGRFPFLPSLELTELHSTLTTFVGPSPETFQAYGIGITYSSSTFVAGSN